MKLLVALILIVLPTFSYGEERSEQIARGRYLTIIGGCNDCHTAGFALSGGNVPESAWLKGDSLGWNGPWGTTYPINLRVYFSNFTEDHWIEAAPNLKPRPPMPGYLFSTMSKQDLRDLYKFIRSLDGPPGESAPQYLPPGQKPTGPIIQFPTPPT